MKNTYGRPNGVNIPPFNKLPQRIHDWRHERLIRKHHDACKACLDAGDKAGARTHWLAMARAISVRSPEQVRRMEVRRGLI